MLRTCQNCGAEFTARPRHPKQRFCSAKCNKAHNYQASKPAEVDGRTCSRCGVGVSGKKDKRFCSKKCYDADYRDTHTSTALMVWTKYRLRPAEYSALLAGGCEVCGTVERLVVDHDHACCPGERTCGKCIRGVLCARCNAAEGQLLGDPNRAMQLALYMLKNTNVLEMLNA